MTLIVDAQAGPVPIGCQLSNYVSIFTVSLEGGSGKQSCDY